MNYVASADEVVRIEPLTSARRRWVSAEQFHSFQFRAIFIAPVMISKTSQIFKVWEQTRKLAKQKQDLFRGRGVLIQICHFTFNYHLTHGFTWLDIKYLSRNVILPAPRVH